MKKRNLSCIKKVTALLAAAVVLLGSGAMYEIHDVKESVEAASHAYPLVSSGSTSTTTSSASKQKVTVTTKTSTKTTTKTLSISKASTKTYTQTLPTKTNTSTKTVKKDSKTTVKTQTTVKTYTTKKYTKGSKKVKQTTKAVTTVKTTTTVVITVAAKTSSTVKTISIATAAPKMSSQVISAFNTLGFNVKIDSSVGYSGHFSAKDKTITLRTNDDTIYHELGHFVAFVSGNYDTSSKFKTVYNKEKSLYTRFDKAYITADSSEYFAECVRDYFLRNAELKSQRPQSYAAVEEALSKITTAQVAKIKLVLSML